jgi:hypothetical protein
VKKAAPKADDEFDWDKPSNWNQAKKTVTNTPATGSHSALRKIDSGYTFGKGAGKDDLGAGDSVADWGAADGWDDDNKKGKFGASSKNDEFEGRNSYQGFGIKGKAKPSAPFGVKRNSADNDPADLLDNILDDIEEKKGLESSKASVNMVKQNTSGSSSQP